MPKTYAAILRGDSVEWLGDDRPPDDGTPVKALITVLQDDVQGKDGTDVASVSPVLVDSDRRNGVKHTARERDDERQRKGRLLDALDALAAQDAFPEIEELVKRQSEQRGKMRMPAVIATHVDELGRVCAEYNVLRLELFGSAASGGYRPGDSDLDFLVEFMPLSPGAYADAYFGLHEALRRLFGCSVDLVIAKSIKNPYFLESVNQTRTLVYGG